MRRSPAVARLALFLVLLAPLASAAAQALKVLNLPDYGRWNRITSTALSPDGKWMSYAYQPNEGDATLYVKQLDGDKVFTIPIGSTPAAAADLLPIAECLRDTPARSDRRGPWREHLPAHRKPLPATDWLPVGRP